MNNDDPLHEGNADAPFGQIMLVLLLLAFAIAFIAAVFNTEAKAHRYRGTPTQRTHYVDARTYEAGPALTPEQAEEQLTDAIEDCRPILWTRPANAARAAAYARRCK